MKTLGILGGMGPLATSDFYRKVIDLTPAQDDPDHIAVVMVANPRIPLRIAAWEGHGPSPVPALTVVARQLVAMGAGVIAMPCNTAHYWYAQLQAAVPHAQFLHIADEAMRAVAARHPQARHIGLLATHATVKMGLYQASTATFCPTGASILRLDDEAQNQCSASITAIKAGNLAQGAQALQPAVKALIAQGAEVIVLGCTELPLVMQSLSKAVPLIDATETLAQAAIAACNT
jgi:aspartate racemase